MCDSRDQANLPDYYAIDIYRINEAEAESKELMNDKPFVGHVRIKL